MSLLRVALTFLFGAVCFAGGYLLSELSNFYSAIRMDWSDGTVVGTIPQHFGNRDTRAIAAAICHGDHLIERYEENITAAGGADFVRFSCAQ